MHDTWNPTHVLLPFSRVPQGKLKGKILEPVAKKPKLEQSMSVPNSDSIFAILK